MKTDLQLPVRLPFSLKRALLKEAKPFICPPKGVLISPGMPLNCAWWLSEGLLKSYTYDQAGNQQVAHFYQGSALVFESELFLMEKPARCSIEAIRPSRLLAIPYPLLSDIQRKYPELTAPFIQQLLTPSRQKLQYLQASPLQRFIMFQKHFPAQYISRADIASYLSLTANSISRLRKQT